jgi:hypothetical protein
VVGVWVFAVATTALEAAVTVGDGGNEDVTTPPIGFGASVEMVLLRILSTDRLAALAQCIVEKRSSAKVVFMMLDAESM